MCKCFLKDLENTIEEASGEKTDIWHHDMSLLSWHGSDISTKHSCLSFFYIWSRWVKMDNWKKRQKKKKKKSFMF